VQDVFADDPKLGTEGVEVADIDSYTFDYVESSDSGWIVSAAVSCSVRVRLH